MVDAFRFACRHIFYPCFKSLIRNIRSLNNKFCIFFQLRKNTNWENSNPILCTTFNDFSFVTYLVHICIQLSISVIIKHRFVHSSPLKFFCSSKIQVTMLRVTYSLVSWKYVIKNFLSHYLIYSWILYLIFFSLTKQVQVFIFTEKKNEMEKILNIKGKKISKMSSSYFFLHLAVKKLNRKNIYT